MKFNLKSAFKAYQSGNLASLIKSGEEYFSVLKKIIYQAKNEIHLHVYIFNDDETGLLIFNELLKARKRGVEVYLLIDIYGSRNLSPIFIKEIIDSGIHFRHFSQFINSKGFHFGRRLHQKVAVVDSKIALVSGINITDRYRGAGKEKPWLDFGLLVEGPLCENISDICASFWKRKFTRKNLKNNFIKLDKENRPLLRVRQNDWMRNKSQISKSYKYALNNAEKYITIVGAYFLPGRKLRHLIKRAVKRGVRIRVIVSKKSDGKIFSLAIGYLYAWMHRIGIEIYEYYPTVVHGKATVVDDVWLTIGSHDLNFLSTYGMIEMNLDVIDENLAKEFNIYLEDIMNKECQRVTFEHIQKKSAFKRFLNWSAYVLMRISLWLLVFITKKDDSDR